MDQPKKLRQQKKTMFKQKCPKNIKIRAKSSFSKVGKVILILKINTDEKCNEIISKIFYLGSMLTYANAHGVQQR